MPPQIPFSDVDPQNPGSGSYNRGSSGSGASVDGSPRASLPADQLLPPVEAPSGAFIVQLFVIPAVIVAIVLLLGMLINALVDRGAHDPQVIVKTLRSSSQARFQKANDLAEMLRMDQQYPELKSHEELARALATMLDEMRTADDAGSESAVVMRRILCGALGQFHVDTGLGALIATAAADPDRDIRGSAVESIATLAQFFGDQSPRRALDHPQLAETLGALANQQDEVLRTKVAFALGVLGSVPGSDARYGQELTTMLDDFCPDARYNAATGLARTGDLRSMPTLVEMLDLEAIQASVDGEQKFDERVSDQSLARQRAAKRDLIVVNALKAARTLAQFHDATELTTLTDAIDRFIARGSTQSQEWPIAPSLLRAAEQVRDQLKDR